MQKTAFTIILYFIISFSISADDMIKRTGELVANIKATVLRGGVSVEYEDGKILQFTKKVIKSIKFRPVIWKAKVMEKGKSPEELAADKLKTEEAEKTRLAEATVNGDEWEARPEEEQINPWGNFALGLIPGYSGLYRTGNTGWGIAFSVIETALLINFIDVQTAKKSKTVNASTFLGIDSINKYCGGTSSNLTTCLMSFSFINGDFSGKQTYDYTGGITGRVILAGHNAPEDQKKMNTMYSLSAGALLGVLLADGLFSYMSASNWNEGTYKGEPSKRTTTPFQRAWRSMIFPGFGQLYGGNTIKGYGFMAIGALLAGKSYADDQKVDIAQKDYMSNAQGYAVSFKSVNPILEPFGYITSKQRRDDIDEKTAARDRTQTALALFWIYNVIDAYFFSGKDKTVSEGDFRMYPTLNPKSYIAGQTEQKYGLTAEFTF